jgi:leucyl/phenylalanyl-tRNA--protein transferase
VSLVRLPLGSPETFPDVATARQDYNGLLAIGGDLSPERLLAAYRRGIFPWFSSGEPIAWFSPAPRMLLLPAAFRWTRSLAKRRRNGGLQLSSDRAFLAVMHGCASAPRDGQSGTWITREMQIAYCRLHRLGIAHSVEVWDGARLVGGLYGLQIGAAFFGESMFSHVPDASKLALWALAEAFAPVPEAMVDCQLYTDHLASLGARLVERDEFDRRRQLALSQAMVWPSQSFTLFTRRAPSTSR